MNKIVQDEVEEKRGSPRGSMNKGGGAIGVRGNKVNKNMMKKMKRHGKWG